ncbi:hypothetical protein BELL_0536g00110 [Botrytis elliptica]|uniref:C2H2-type domain-containing protein n=1 Tax=Botrytis elliptica TaxID=278938 RepID=A0A4Z1JDI0_9HELO|nr:hypothetical protein BELL_0536g00110 [Botrytis elliptica]
MYITPPRSPNRADPQPEQAPKSNPETMKDAESQSKKTSDSGSNPQEQGKQDKKPVSEAKRQRDKRRWKKYGGRKKQKKNARKLNKWQDKQKTIEGVNGKFSGKEYDNRHLPPTPQLNPTKSFPNAAHDEVYGFGDPMSIDEDHDDDDDSSLQNSTVSVTVQPVGTTTINPDSTLRAIARNARLQIDIVDASYQKVDIQGRSWNKFEEFLSDLKLMPPDLFRPYQCSICSDYTVGRRYSLRTHYMMKHEQALEFPKPSLKSPWAMDLLAWKCQLCPPRSLKGLHSERTTLKNHLQSQHFNKL